MCIYYRIMYYFNNVINMISTVYKSDGMYYSNNEEITLYGFNINFQKKFFNQIDINSVYSYTDGISNDSNLIEGISNHTFNIRFKYNIFKKINILFTSKYHSSKNVFIYDTEETKSLEGHIISDMLLSFRYKHVSIKAGIKNMFDYLDSTRLNSDSQEFLTSTDPGKRFYFNIVLSI